MIGTLATFFLSALPLGPAGGPQPRDKEPPQEAPGALGRALAVAPATWYWIGRDELGWVRMRAHRDALTAARVVAVYDALTAAQAGRLKCVEAPFGIRLANPGRETLAALADATGLQYLVLDFDECPDWLTEVLASFSRLAYLERRLSEPGKCPDGLLAAVAGMDGLTHLSLSGVNVGSQQGMEAFFRMPLESLALSYCTGLSVVFNERLADMPRLRSVEVHGTRISGRTTRAIATCPRVDAKKRWSQPAAAICKCLPPHRTHSGSSHRALFSSSSESRSGLLTRGERPVPPWSPKPAINTLVC